MCFFYCGWLLISTPLWEVCICMYYELSQCDGIQLCKDFLEIFDCCGKTFSVYSGT